MRCEHILSKGIKKGQTCGVYTNFKAYDNKYLCCTHRKNLKKYKTVKETVLPINTVPKKLDPIEEDRNTNEIETIDLPDPSHTSLEDHEDVEDLDRMEEQFRRGMKGIVSDEAIEDYVATRINGEEEQDSSSNNKYDEFKESVEARLSELYELLKQNAQSVEPQTEEFSVNDYVESDYGEEEEEEEYEGEELIEYELDTLLNMIPQIPN